MNAEAWPEAKGGVRLVKSGRAPGHRTRILVADRDAGAVAEVMNILRAQDWEVIIAKNGAEALSKARQDGPDAVITELALGDMTGPDLCRTLHDRTETANTPVFVLSASSGVAERVASLRAGASDYLVKPPDPSELIARLKAALDLRTDKAGFVVVVLGGKGGVGTSFVAVNLAVALRQETRSSVVLLDAAGRAGTVDVMLNLQGNQAAGRLLPRLDELDSADFESMLTPHASGLQAMLLHDQGNEVQPEQMRKILIALRKSRDYVVIDTCSLLDETAASALEVADRLLLVLTPEITSLRGAKLFLEQAGQLGLSRERIVPVLNRFPQRGGLQRRAVENAMGIAVQGVVPDDIKLVTYSVNRGVPVVESHGRTVVAKQIIVLAQMLIKAAQQG
jgi:pilus assembly protein CpaE